MRKGLLAALTFLVLSPGSGRAQENGPSSAAPFSSLTPAPRNRSGDAATEPISPEFPLWDAPEPPGVHDPDPVTWRAFDERDLQGPAPGFFGSAEYLMWWFRNDRVPPLLTGGGVPGSPGYQVFVDNLDFADRFRSGGRVTFGYRFESDPQLGVEANYFFFAGRRDAATMSSGGDPILARPYIDAVSGQSAVTFVAFPDMASGAVTITTSTKLQGAEVNFAAAGLDFSDAYRARVFAGFRFLRLDDLLRIDEQFQVAPNVPNFGGSAVSLYDEFGMVNRFYGGQIGFEAARRFGALSIDLRGKFAFGQMQQKATINGATTVTNNGSTVQYVGGLLALATNIGGYGQNEFAFVPEVDVNFALSLTPRARLLFGYSFLWISTVARAGEQIDPVVNPRYFPILSSGPPTPLRPAFQFHDTSFWAQGLNFGLELTF